MKLEVTIETEAEVEEIIEGTLVITDIIAELVEIEIGVEQEREV